MPKYVKKPIPVEAVQWFEHGTHPAVLTYHEAYDKGYRTSYPKGYPSMGYIQTLEGFQEVTPGDYIIRGIRGEYYPCKPDIFENSYERVEESNG